MRNQNKYLAIDIGGSFIKYGIITDEYKIIHKYQKNTIGFHDSDAFIDYLLDGIEFDYEAICISVPGIIKENRIISSNPCGNLSVLHKMDLVNEIRKRNKNCVFACNDGIAAAICEHEIGNGKNTPHFLMLTRKFLLKR